VVSRAELPQLAVLPVRRLPAGSQRPPLPAAGAAPAGSEAAAGAAGHERAPDGPVIVAPSSAGDPPAAGLRLGPPHVLAWFDPRDYVLQRPRLGDGTVDTVTAAVSLAVSRVVARGAVPVVLGGDHTVALGGVRGVRSGLARRARRGPPAPLFVLWLDAHPDVNTAETSPTGHLHGMVLSGLLGAGPLATADALPPERVTLAGVRSVDPGEADFLAQRPGIARWGVETLQGDGWMAPLAALLERVRRAGGRLYVSLDLDVFDPQAAPGVAVPVSGGALPDPVLALLRRVRASGLLAGADVVELFPPADRERQTARLAARALAALGAAADWRDVLEPEASAPRRREGRGAA
jgi:arginase